MLHRHWLHHHPQGKALCVTTGTCFWCHRHSTIILGMWLHMAMGSQQQDGMCCSAAPRLEMHCGAVVGTVMQVLIGCKIQCKIKSWHLLTQLHSDVLLLCMNVWRVCWSEFGLTHVARTWCWCGWYCSNLMPVADIRCCCDCMIHTGALNR